MLATRARLAGQGPMYWGMIQRASRCFINSATQNMTSSYPRQKVILSPSDLRTIHTTPSRRSHGTVQKTPLSKSMILAPFFVRVLLLFIFLSFRFFRPLSGGPTGLRKPRCCFLSCYFYIVHMPYQTGNKIKKKKHFSKSLLPNKLQRANYFV